VFCTECGTQSSVNAKFCENCGTAIGQSVPSPSMQPLESGTTAQAPIASRTPKWPLFVGIGIAVVLVIGGVAVATSKAGNKSSSDGASRGETATAPTDKTILNVSGTGTRWIAAPPISESATVEYSWDCTNIGASAPINIDNTVYTSGFLANQGFSGTGTGQFSAINKTTAFLVSTPCAWTLKLIASGSATVGAFDPNACVARCDGSSPAETSEPTASPTPTRAAEPRKTFDIPAPVLKALLELESENGAILLGGTTSGPVPTSAMPKSLPVPQGCEPRPGVTFDLAGTERADFNSDGITDLAGFYGCVSKFDDGRYTFAPPVRILDGASPNPNKPNLLGILDVNIGDRYFKYERYISQIYVYEGKVFILVRFPDGTEDCNDDRFGRTVLVFAYGGGKFNLLGTQALSRDVNSRCG
jgi:hypothetical protein